MRHDQIPPVLRRTDRGLPSDRLTESEGEFSITRAGLFFDICRSHHLINRRGHVRSFPIAMFAWAPIVVASAIRVLSGKPLDAVAVDPAVHVRLLVAIPLLLLAERALEVRCRAAVHVVRQEELAPRDVLEPIVHRAAQLRASQVVEGCIALLAFVSGQAALWGVWSPSVFADSAERLYTTSFATFWYASVGLPLVQFLVLRWLWRWIVWTYVLVRLSRVDLATNALHPDGAAGLKLLSDPIDAFAVFVASNCFIISAEWTTQVFAHAGTVQMFAPRFLAFAIFAIVAACGPLFLFSRQIYQARKRDVEHLHALAYDYVREFRRKWITYRGDRVPRTLQPLLGTPDLQSLNDLDGSYEYAEKTRAIPFGAKPIIAVCLGAVVPMLPLLLSTMSLRDIARSLGKMLQLPFI
jgi:hypothetical protein